VQISTNHGRGKFSHCADPMVRMGDVERPGIP
jgi:hypothetical protein